MSREPTTYVVVPELNVGHMFFVVNNQSLVLLFLKLIKTRGSYLRLVVDHLNAEHISW